MFQVEYLIVEVDFEFVDRFFSLLLSLGFMHVADGGLLLRIFFLYFFGFVILLILLLIIILLILFRSDFLSDKRSKLLNVSVQELRHLGHSESGDVAACRHGFNCVLLEIQHIIELCF